MEHEVTVIPIIIGALGIVTKGFLQELDDLEKRGRVEITQTIAIIKIGKNTKKSSGELGRLVRIGETVRSNQLTPCGKIIKRE